MYNEMSVGKYAQCLLHTTSVWAVLWGRRQYGHCLRKLTKHHISNEGREPYKAVVLKTKQLYSGQCITVST